MKTELDNLMQQRSLDALLVSGGTHENPCMYYLANGAKVGASTLAIKQRGHEPVLIVVGMEQGRTRQCAAAGNIRCQCCAARSLPPSRPARCR